MFSVAINGISCQIAEGGSILEALRSRNIEVPTLCYDERLAPFGGCRLCVVGVEGFARPVAACTTPIRDGMVIKTHTKELESLRKTLLRLLAKEYPAQAVADFPDKQLHRYLSDYGLEDEVCNAANRSEPRPNRMVFIRAS
jgi:formate dehydrogenase major subunit